MTIPKPRRAWPPPDLSLVGKVPRNRPIEEVAQLIVDAELLGGAGAARRHRISPSTVAQLTAKWLRHPTVLAALEARRPEIEARLSKIMEPLRKMLEGS